SQDVVIAYADAMAHLGRVLLAIANDLRLRSSGPFGGLAEVRLQAVQPGSSIMPGKVNPVIPEAVSQVALQVEGCAATCRASAALHQLDLSHANPLLAWNVDTMGTLLSHACDVLVHRCLKDLSINESRTRRYAESSPAMATGLASRLGYEKAAELAKASEKEQEPVAVMARKKQVLPEEELQELLDIDRLAGL
ncbi:MAG: lyase family protein, partial [Myxococcota bacterium]